jgi:hypothetical protein
MADAGDAIGGLIGLCLIVMAIILVVVLVYYLLLYVLLPAGALYGAVTSLRNYVQALTGNVKPQQVAS